MINRLLPGGESQERLNILLEGTSIRSPEKIKALQLHLVHGWPKKSAATKAGVDPSNFTEALQAVEKIASIVERVKELDWAHLKLEK